MSKKVSFIFFVLCLSLVLTACQTPGEKLSEKASEKLAEKAIEGSTGGKADVDINNENVNVTTEQGSAQVGNKISIPSGFPSDVYVFEGDIKAAFYNKEVKGYTVSIETDKSMKEVKEVYEKKLAENNWDNRLGTMDYGDSYYLSGEKDARVMSVVIARSGEKTSVIVGVSENYKTHKETGSSTPENHVHSEDE